jgi:hypothetical protein
VIIVRSSIAAATSVLCCVLLTPVTASAQGKGHGHAFGHGKGSTGGVTSGPSAAGAAAVQPEGIGVRNFGTWLDDATVLTPGAGAMTFAVGYWRTPGFREFDAPSFDVGVGLTRRVQLGASVPFYHAREPGGPVIRGLGDLYVSSKIQLRSPTTAAGKSQVGLAVIPVMEVLSVAPSTGTGRVSWALPATVEIQRDGWRAYGSAGYFTRGSLFATGALEVSLSDRAWVTGTISESRSSKRDDLSEALGFAKVRTDVSGGITIAASQTMAVFGMVGRTISRQDPNSTKSFLTGGVSVNFTAWRRVTHQ